MSTELGRGSHMIMSWHGNTLPISITFDGYPLVTSGDVHDYRKISNIRRTKSLNFNVSRLVLQLTLPNPMKPGIKSRMKM